MRPIRLVRIRLVPICGFHGVARNPHRVDANDDWCANLDGTFETDLAATPEILDLQRLAFRKTHEHHGSVPFQAVNHVRVLKREPTTNLRHWHIGTRREEAT